MRVVVFIAGILGASFVFSSAVTAKPVRLSTPDDGWAVRMGLHNGSSSPGGYTGTSSRPDRGARSSSSRSSSSRSSSSRSSEFSSSGRSSGVGPRPGAWCGWWMRTQRGGGPEFNLAANWRRYGRPASPQVGAVVVWDHHVGQIVGRASNGQWMVQSGNDGGAVRTRPRSISGATVRV